MINLLKITDLSREDIYDLFDRAATMKMYLRKCIRYTPLSGKTLGLIFDKSSTRTRVSFEVGASQLGGHSIFLSPKDTQAGRGEPVADMARVLSGYLDGVVIRTYSQDDLEEFARYASIPVINGLTDLLHPCQVLTDLFTIREEKGAIDNLKIAWIGDGNNMANSWILAAAKLGFRLVVACPDNYRPTDEVLAIAAKDNLSNVEIIKDPFKAAKNADVINTDVWASMGQEDEQEERKEIFANYQVNKNLLSHAKNDAVVMHCLPAHRDEEITDDVIESDQSIIFIQAENRLHLQKAILEKLMG